MYGTLPPQKDPFKWVLVKDGKDVDGFIAFVYSSTYSFFVSFISSLRSVFSAFSVLILFSNNWCSVMLHIAISLWSLDFMLGELLIVCTLTLEVRDDC